MTDLEERLRDAAPRPTRGLDVDALAHAAARRTRRHRATVGAVVAGLVVVLIAGIAVVQQRSDSESLDVVGVPDSSAGVAEDSLVRLLGRFPRHAADEFGMGMLDLGRARATLGIGPLPSGADDLDVADHLDQILEGTSSSVGPAEGVTSSQLRAELGFGLEDIDQRIRVGIAAGLDPFYVATGRFDRARIDAAVRSDPRWGPMLQVKEYRGFEYYSWGGDLGTSPEITPVRPMGQGGRLVVGDGWLSWTLTDANAEATIDAFLDPRMSAAGIPWLRTAAEAADDAKLSVFTVLPLQMFGPSSDASAPLLDVPLVVATGASGSPENNGRTVGLVYDDERRAEANAGALEETLGVPVTRSGSVLLATLPQGENPFGQGRALRFRPGTEVQRPELPDRRPTQAEALADDKVSAEEYELAFWTFVECAEEVGADFDTITREDDARFRYDFHTSVSTTDDCYNEHFLDVDSAWKVSD